MGTDLFKQGIDGDATSHGSTMPVVKDPTGALSLSRTMTPVQTGPKVPSIPEPDPDLLALFAPQVDGDFDLDGLGDQAGDSGSSVGPDEDWQDLLDASIPVRSLAKEKTSRAEPVPTVGQPAAKPRFGLFGFLSSALARPTADERSTPAFARSADAFGEREDQPAVTGSIPRIDPDGGATDRSPAGERTPSKPATTPSADPPPDLLPAPGRNGMPEPSPATVSQLAAIAKPRAHRSPDTEAGSHDDSAPTPSSATTERSAVAAGSARTEDSAATARSAATEDSAATASIIGRHIDTNPAGEVARGTDAAEPRPGAPSILAAVPEQTTVERPVDTVATPLTLPLSRAGAARSRRTIVVAGAAVACLAVIAAILTTGDSRDGGTDTAADTEQVAAQNRPVVEDVAPSPTSTTSRADEAGDDRGETTLDVSAAIAAADLARRPSSTVERTDAGSDTTDTAGSTGSTGRQGRPATGPAVPVTRRRRARAGTTPPRPHRRPPLRPRPAHRNPRPPVPPPDRPPAPA